MIYINNDKTSLEDKAGFAKLEKICRSSGQAFQKMCRSGENLAGPKKTTTQLCTLT